MFAQFIHLDYSNIIMTVFTVIITAMVGTAGRMINKYLKRKEIAEKESQRRQELHFMKIDAVIYAIAASSDSVHSEMFTRKYQEHLKQLVEENKILNSQEDM